MIKALRAKFTQHADLRSKLIETGDSFLVEGNVWHDNTYGVCVCNMTPIRGYSSGNHADSANPKCTGKGQNLLGKALMQIREEVKVNENKEI